ncbi:MAG TPA: GNAT family N-acetyltransferase [Patescibacteria group bacterium]|nr:GNAT family N-acetyltransferase [Patescibacteria group bacterium]
MDLIRANRFTLEQLTEAYNETRNDYIVPMPMNVARFREYIYLYDIDLSASWVATRGDIIYGLGMLGIRSGRAWISRVGVLPWGRRQGIGRSIINKLLDSAGENSLDTIYLEVIAGNEPASQLFLTSGFQRTRELIVARRPPHSNHNLMELEEKPQIRELNRDQTLSLLEQRTGRPNWLNETDTFRKLSDLRGFSVQLPGGSQGWICYEVTFLQVTRTIVEVLEGDPVKVTRAALCALHERHPAQDAVLENLPGADPNWIGFSDIGYFEVFRRTEMVKVNS